MANDHFIIHIQTRALDAAEFDEEKKFLNPIDARIVALGIRYRGKNFVFAQRSEREMLHDFWRKWDDILMLNANVDIVGFNVTNFDLPFITARSFLYDVPIAPFLLKNIVDIREKINAYRYGPTRGKLIEYAGGKELIDKMHCTDEELCTALAEDLEVIDKLYERAKRTNILEIRRW